MLCSGIALTHNSLRIKGRRKREAVKEED